jgi:glycine C-acetyltransferase
MAPHLDWLEEELQALGDAGFYNNIRTISSAQGAWLVIEGRKVLNFCSNNYLGLANHPRMVAAAKRAIDNYGVGPGAVRIISGTNDLHIELERRVAKFKQVEAALSFQSGFQANTASIPAMVGKEDAIYYRWLPFIRWEDHLLRTLRHELPGAGY